MIDNSEIICDIVMWAKNGESVLRPVLKQIDKVIPQENTHKKILVDDHSTDKTINIAKEFNWEIYTNPKIGIPSGANEALSHVDCPFFISVEQDVVLEDDWYETISKYMCDKSVAVAHGVLIATEPKLRKIDEYSYSRQHGVGACISNNMFRTDIIRSLGGFPTGCGCCADTILRKKILYETRYKWVVDSAAVSQHIRSLKTIYNHEYLMAALCTHTKYCVCPRFNPFLYARLLLTSPFRALIVAISKGCPEALWIYPKSRYCQLKGVLKRGNWKSVVSARA